MPTDFTKAMGGPRPLAPCMPESHKPMFEGEGIRARLRKYGREPFLDILESWLENAPEGEDIRRLAAENPAQYVGAMKQLAQLAGYVDKREQETTVNVNVSSMTDTELRDRLSGLADRLGLAAKAEAEASAPVIEGQSRPVESESSDSSAMPSAKS